jgi:hypothetical protein
METSLELEPGTRIEDRVAARASHLQLDAAAFRESFDREPIAYRHDLHTLDAFKPDSLIALAHAYDAHPRDYFVSAGAASAASEFFSVPSGMYKPSEAMARLGSAGLRILLKRPENHDPRFRRLLDELFADVMALRGGLQGERLVRLEAGLFITSAASTTPFHFDPEIAFFSQIEGDKVYHAYSPAAVRDGDLEKFYLQGQISIGQVDLKQCDSALERVFKLAPGLGFHQPQNSPHWVETRGTRSISYSFVYETDASRARGRVRAYNYYLRKFGVAPRAPGSRAWVDGIKSGTMQVLIPARRRVAALMKGVRRKRPIV